MSIDKEVFTKLTMDGDDLLVRRSQDVEDIVDHAKFLAEQPQHGADFHHRWSLPAVMVEDFYKRYCGADKAEARPMDQNFWEWVHKQMKDPQYSKFWTHNPSNPFFVGYNGNG